jgi:DNA polymerase III epsilon subunit-like protein
MVYNSPTIAQVLPLFVQFAGDDTLAMHNAAFDGGFLKHELGLNNINKTFEYYCTLINARQLVKSSNFKLATLKNILNLKTYGSMHRALSDTYVTAQLFLKLQKNYGIDTMATLEKSLNSLMSRMEKDDVFVMDKDCS